MATQRPPWFRLPTMRPPAPAPTPAPAPPRPPAAVRPIRSPSPPPSPTAPPSPPKPTATPSSPPQAPTAPPSKPTSPVKTTNFPPQSPVAPPAPQPSPPRTPAAAPPLTKAAALTNIQQQSPSSVSTSPQMKTTTQSKSTAAANNNVKQATPISSPLQLPPPQIRIRPDEEGEQKSVLVQENMEKPPTETNNVHIHKGNREAPPPPSPTKNKDKGTKANTIKKVVSESEDLGMRVITIAGDNRGALMEITSSNNKTNPPGRARARARGYTLGNKSSEQGKSDHDDKDQNEWQSMATFLNSNVQGVNNSIVFNSSCHHNNPGIHLSIVTNLNANANANASRHG